MGVLPIFPNACCREALSPLTGPHGQQRPLNFRPPPHNALHLRRRDDEAAGGRAPRPAHVEALPLVGAIADAGLQVAQGACGTGAGNGQRVRGRRPPQRSQPPPNGRSPCSAHATASIAARPRRPAPANPAAPPRRARPGRGGAGRALPACLTRSRCSVGKGGKGRAGLAAALSSSAEFETRLKQKHPNVVLN